MYVGIRGYEDVYVYVRACMEEGGWRSVWTDMNMEVGEYADHNDDGDEKKRREEERIVRR